MISTIRALTAGLYGSAIGDALGQPAQFNSFADQQTHPVTEMAVGVYDTRPGTWSDDTSMTLATLAAMSTVTSPQEQLRTTMTNFEAWLTEGAFTPAGWTFDEGNGTVLALTHYRTNHDLFHAGSDDEQNNGNGALMRFLVPALYYTHLDGTAIFDHPDHVRALIDLAQLTHRHPRSTVACLIYTAMVAQLVTNPQQAPQQLIQTAITTLTNASVTNPALTAQMVYFKRLADPAFYQLQPAQLTSSGYVVDTLEVVCWLLNQPTNYRETMLTAVNFGGDADTIACIAGGLIAIRDGLAILPSDWLQQLQGQAVLHDSLHTALQSGQF